LLHTVYKYTKNFLEMPIIFYSSIWTELGVGHKAPVDASIGSFC